MAIVKIQGKAEKAQHVYYMVDTAAAPLGVGGMGQVFKGKRIEETTGMETDVAVKFLFDDLNEAAIERARREASVQIESENLVKMYGFIQIDEKSPSGIHPRYHVVSELLHGVMLLDLLNGKLTDSDGKEVEFARKLYEQYNTDRYGFAIFIVKNILSGIMALHDKGFIHRDIDPSNVMVTSDGKVKIIDFGIAKQIDSLSADRHLTSTGQFMGKAAYAAPELVRGDVPHQNATTDIYAIGIVMFELITGKLPFDGPMDEVLGMQLHEKLPVSIIPVKAARNVIAKATEKKQANRYQSAAEFRVAVEQLARNPKTNPGTFAIEEKPDSWLAKVIHDKKAMLSAAAVAILAVAIGIAVLPNEEGEADRTAMQQTAKAASMKEVIVDDPEPYMRVDSTQGTVYKSIGYLTEQALSTMSDSANVTKAMAMLDKVIATGKKSSAKAAYVKGIMFLKNGNVPASLQEKRSIAQSVITPDDSMAHTCYLKSASLDSTFYPALFELGTDYHNGPLRGISDVNDEMSKIYFEKALKYARQSGDDTYIQRCNKAFGFFD